MSDNKQYFLVQVSEPGSKNLLQKNPIYQHVGWQETPRDIDHGKVKPGDFLLVYFARNAIDFSMQLKRIYEVTSVSTKNEIFSLKEVDELHGISLDVIKNGIENGNLSDKFDKLGQQGFNIARIERNDYDDILQLTRKLNNGQTEQTRDRLFNCMLKSIAFLAK